MFLGIHAKWKTVHLRDKKSVRSTKACRFKIRIGFALTPISRGSIRAEQNFARQTIGKASHFRLFSLHSPRIDDIFNGFLAKPTRSFIPISQWLLKDAPERRREIYRVHCVQHALYSRGIDFLLAANRYELLIG